VSEIPTGGFANSKLHCVLLTRLLVQMRGEDLTEKLEAKTSAIPPRLMSM
jgi:hypothetical protein